MANFTKTGDMYVDPSNPNASNANAGTDQNFPKLSIQRAIDAAGTGQKIIVADGLYNESGWTGVQNGVIIEGDGIVIFEGDNTVPLLENAVSGSQYELHNVIIINYTFAAYFAGGNNNPRLKDCTIINSPIFGRKGSNTVSVTMENCRLVNSYYDVVWSSLLYSPGQPSQDWNRNIKDCIFINSSVLVNVALVNCYLDSEVTLQEPATASTEPISASNFNDYLSSINYDGVLYFSLSAHQTANPTVDQNSISADGLFNRVGNETGTLDFSVQGISPLLGAGSSGSNIGAVKRGIPSTRNSDSVQNGTISNIVFDGNRFQIQGANTTGTITSAPIDFGLTVKSPIINIKGLVNFLDNVPDFDNALRDPNKLDIECRWAIIGEDITQQAWKPFLFNELMLLDSTGKSNGEANFDWNDTVIIPMKEVQYRLTLRQNYNN